MSSTPIDAERWDRQRAREAFARFASLRSHPEKDSGRDHTGQTEYERLRNELVVAHLNLARYLAVKFANRGEALDDLIQVGTVGLLKAIDRFDLERGVEFTTYATPTIVGEIKRYFRDKGWAVKVPRRLQELNLAVNRAIEKLNVKLGHSPTVTELAEHLGATEEDVLEAQELGPEAYNQLSLDTELAGDGDKKSQTLADYVGRNDSALELLEDRANLERAFEVLSGRERVILYLRFYESVSQTEIAKRLNVSQMHASRASSRRPSRNCADFLKAMTRHGAARLSLVAPANGEDGRLIMRSQELRSSFVEYFVRRGHVHLASASLIPDAMSTTLFTIAGMEQFVPVFLGEEAPPAPRAVTVQRCLRVAGAKSDIENVGRTGRHGTFLEMLGNFSFGDYYKREAINFAWDLATNVWKLDKDKLYVTVHTSDDEAQTIWEREMGVASSRITRWDDDNFWTMGATGPCGPCTEIFYDNGPAYASSPDDDAPNKGNRFVEFWNVVFQQYNRGADGGLSDLPRKAIDTGMGFERILALVNGHASMYETDLFTDVIAAQPDAGSTVAACPVAVLARRR